MSAVIKLKRMGTKKKPTTRICVFDSHQATKAKVLDLLGYYYPVKNPPEAKIDKDKALAWIKKGALPSPTVNKIFRKNGIL